MNNNTAFPVPKLPKYVLDYPNELCESENTIIYIYI